MRKRKTFEKQGKQRKYIKYVKRQYFNLYIEDKRRNK